MGVKINNSKVMGDGCDAARADYDVVRCSSCLLLASGRL